jgi:hypothetical protein
MDVPIKVHRFMARIVLLAKMSAPKFQSEKLGSGWLSPCAGGRRIKKGGAPKSAAFLGVVVS